MSDSSDTEIIDKVDLIIIEDVQEREYFYNPKCLDVGIPIKERRKDGFDSISKEIEQKLDVELTGKEVEQRWVTIRKAFVRAKHCGKTYFLEKHLQFLNDFIKSKKQGTIKSYVRTPYQALRLSPVKIVYDISSDEEELKYKDVLQAMQHFSKKADEQVKLSKSTKKEGETFGNFEGEKNSEQVKLSNEDGTNKKEDESFEMLSEAQFFQKLQKDISMIPKITKVPCLMEICMKTHKYFID